MLTGLNLKRFDKTQAFQSRLKNGLQFCLLKERCRQNGVAWFPQRPGGRVSLDHLPCQPLYSLKVERTGLMKF